MCKCGHEGLLLFQDDWFFMPYNSCNLVVFLQVPFSPFLDSNWMPFLFIQLLICPFPVSMTLLHPTEVNDLYATIELKISQRLWQRPRTLAADLAATMREQGHLLHPPHPHLCSLPREVPRQGVAPSGSPWHFAQQLTSPYDNFLLLNFLSSLLFERRMHVLFILLFPVPNGTLYIADAQ